MLTFVPKPNTFHQFTVKFLPSRFLLEARNARMETPRAMYSCLSIMPLPLARRGSNEGPLDIVHICELQLHKQNRVQVSYDDLYKEEKGTASTLLLFIHNSSQLASLYTGFNSTNVNAFILVGAVSQWL